MAEGEMGLPPEARGEVEQPSPPPIDSAPEGGAVESVINQTAEPVPDDPQTPPEIDGSITAPPEAQTPSDDEAEATPGKTPEQVKKEKLAKLLENDRVKAEQIPLLANLEPQQLESVSSLLQKGALSAEALDEFLQLTKDKQAEKLQELEMKEIIIDQMINDQILKEEERDEWRKKDLKGLRISFGARQEKALNDSDSAINQQRPTERTGDQAIPTVEEANYENVNQVSELDDFTESTLKWTGRGGKIDQAIGAMIKNSVEERLRKELSDEAAKAYVEMSAEDRLAKKLVGPNGEALNEEEFVKAYKAQRLDDPEYKAARDQKLAEELSEENLQKQIDEIRGRLKTEPIQDALPKILGKSILSKEDKLIIDKMKAMLKAMPAMVKEQLKITRDEMIDQAFENDFMTLMSLFFSADSAYNNYRSIGTEGENGTRLIGKEHFERALGYPESFGLALAKAYQDKDFRAAGFYVSQPELFAHAINGDSGAIREILEKFLKDLFDSDKTEERWQVAKKVLPEAIFPGVKARFNDTSNDDMKAYFKNLHEDTNAMDRLFNQKGKKTTPDVPTTAPTPAPETEEKNPVSSTETPKAA